EEIFPFSGTGSIGLTYKGWERFEELNLGHFNSKKAFMAMQFGEPELDDIFDKHFKRAVGDTGYDLQSLLDRPKAGLIDDRMRVEIRRSRFLICDLTHNNRGALWEAGFAEGLGKPVIYTCEESVFDSTDPESRPHFDTNHHLMVKWNSNNPEQAVEKLKETIRETLPGEAKFSD
ncbi:hypothetical protein JYT17_00670, partial [Nitrospira defluvii]|nr:hypothetical protein [Nitrospira defluvii]